jgi:hypothetical protein
MAKPGGVCWSASTKLLRLAHLKGCQNNPARTAEAFETAFLAVVQSY